MGLLDFADPLRTKLKGLLGEMPLVQMAQGRAEMPTRAGLLGALHAMPVFDSSVSDEFMGNAMNSITPIGVVGQMFKYAPKYRPPTATNMPNGIKEIGGPTRENKFGTVSYERPLTSRELEQFELSALDPNHPTNIKKAFSDFKEKFMNEFSERGAFEIKRNGSRVGLVTEDASGAPFRVTLMNGDSPTGHDTFDDFDELAKYVWGLGGKAK